MVILYVIGIVVVIGFAIGAFVCNDEEKRFGKKK